MINNFSESNKVFSFSDTDTNATVSNSVQQSIEYALSIMKNNKSKKQKLYENEINPTNQRLSLFGKIIVKMVLFYQKKAPTSLRNSCRFEPSCSNYMILALEKYGTIPASSELVIKKGNDGSSAVIPTKYFP